LNGTKYFFNGHKAINDDSHSDRASTSRNDEMVSKVEEIILPDSQMTKINKTFLINYSTNHFN